MNQIETKMGSLSLHGMSRAWEALKETRQLHELSLLEGMDILLQAEQEERTNRRFKRLSANAGFRYKASIEELRLDPARGLDKNLITTLSTGEYISRGLSVLVSGATGCGKSFLASALGHQACQQGYKVAYFNTQKLMLKAKLVRLEGTSIRFFEKLAKADLLILDDFGLTNLDKHQEMDFMEIIEDRHGKRSTVIVSQLPVGSWYDVFHEETIADAVLDRMIHGSYRVEIKGDSQRKKM
jgi:DNA replication protein DnaC